VLLDYRLVGGEKMAEEERRVVGVISPHTDLPIAVLDRLDEQVIKPRIGGLYNKSGLRGNRIVYRYRSIPPGNHSIGELVGNVGSPRTLRAAIVPEDIDLATPIDAETAPPLLLAIQNSHTDSGWFGSANPSVAAIVHTAPGKVASLLEDIFLDISVATSPAIKPIIRAALAHIPRVEFFKRKVEFLISTFGKETHYGRVNSDIGYLPFGAILRRHCSPYSEDNLVTTWDKFLTSRLHKFFPTSDAAVADLRQRKGIGGQISPAKLSDKIRPFAGGGPYLLLITDKRPRQTRHRTSALAALQAQFAASNAGTTWRKGELHAIPAKQLTAPIREWIQRGNVIALKFYLQSSGGATPTV
jgi:hypothetical protein